MLVTLVLIGLLAQSAFASKFSKRRKRGKRQETFNEGDFVHIPHGKVKNPTKSDYRYAPRHVDAYGRIKAFEPPQCDSWAEITNACDQCTDASWKVSNRNGKTLYRVEYIDKDNGWSGLTYSEDGRYISVDHGHYEARHLRNAEDEDPRNKPERSRGSGRGCLYWIWHPKQLFRKFMQRFWLTRRIRKWWRGKLGGEVRGRKAKSSDITLLWCLNTLFYGGITVGLGYICYSFMPFISGFLERTARAKIQDSDMSDKAMRRCLCQKNASSENESGVQRDI